MFPVKLRSDKSLPITELDIHAGIKLSFQIHQEVKEDIKQIDVGVNSVNSGTFIANSGSNVVLNQTINNEQIASSYLYYSKLPEIDSIREAYVNQSIRDLSGTSTYRLDFINSLLQKYFLFHNFIIDPKNTIRKITESLTNSNDDDKFDDLIDKLNTVAFILDENGREFAKLIAAKKLDYKRNYLTVIDNFHKWLIIQLNGIGSDLKSVISKVLSMKCNSDTKPSFDLPFCVMKFEKVKLPIRYKLIIENELEYWVCDNIDKIEYDSKLPLLPQTPPGYTMCSDDWISRLHNLYIIAQSRKQSTYDKYVKECNKNGIDVYDPSKMTPNEFLYPKCSTDITPENRTALYYSRSNAFQFYIDKCVNGDEYGNIFNEEVVEWYESFGDWKEELSGCELCLNNDIKVKGDRCSMETIFEYYMENQSNLMELIKVEFENHDKVTLLRVIFIEWAIRELNRNGIIQSVKWMKPTLEQIECIKTGIISFDSNGNIAYTKRGETSPCITIPIEDIASLIQFDYDNNYDVYFEYYKEFRIDNEIMISILNQIQSENIIRLNGHLNSNVNVTINQMNKMVQKSTSVFNQMDDLWKLPHPELSPKLDEGKNRMSSIGIVALIAIIVVLILFVATMVVIMRSQQLRAGFIKIIKDS